jgi:hypothetical protein
VALRRDRRVGVVVLSNSAVGIVDELGLRLMKLLAGQPVEPLKLGSGERPQMYPLFGYIGRNSVPRAVALRPILISLDRWEKCMNFFD